MPAPAPAPAPATPPTRSVWAPRCAVLSTMALVLSFATTGSARALLAFTWVCLALAAMALEFAARRRAGRGSARRRAGRTRV